MLRFFVQQGRTALEAILPIELASRDLLAAAHRHCAVISKRAAGNFHYAFLALPRMQRHGIQALYAFCRAGDDAADDLAVLSDRSKLLEQLKRRLDLCYQGFYSDLMTLALADAVRRFRFDRAHFDELLLGIEGDLDGVTPRTLDDLRQYCYRVASTVGLLCLKIFGADTDSSRRFAIELGIGMQLTNILRDLKEDLDRGRLYLPHSALEKHQLTGPTLFEIENNDRRSALVREMSELAREHFRAAAASLPPELCGKLIAARIMGKIYEVILTRIEAEPLSNERVELTRLEKLSIVRRVLMEDKRFIKLSRHLDISESPA